MTAAAPTQSLLYRGAFHARRRHDLSSPSLIGSLLVIAALGVIAGLALFGKLLSDDVARQDRARLSDAAMISASYVDRIILRAELDMNAVLQRVEPATTPPSPETLRALRREIADMLAISPLGGVALIDENETVVLEVAQSEMSTAAMALAQPLESEATLLSSRLRLVAPAGGDAPILHMRSGGEHGWRIAGVFDPAVLSDALRPEGETADFVTASYLLDQEGRVLATTDGQASTETLQAPAAPYNAAPLDEAAVTTIKDGSGGQRLLATSMLEGEDLRVVHVGRQQGGGAVFERAGLLTMALVGPCLLGLILLISVIQNEWRKTDRRVNSASDAVARAEVASDLLQAGIVDWTTEDSSVTYTRGWRDLFGYADGVSGEQVFDWIGRIHGDDRSDARLRYQELLDGETTTIDHTIRVLCADGSYTHVRERGAVRSDAHGHVSRIVLVQTPFVRKRAEESGA